MLDVYRAKVDTFLKHLPDWCEIDPALSESMKYSLLDGGKRIRPSCLLCVCDMLGGDVENAVPYAAALEMIHTYSLIHDDLPAMDNDDYRRGKPSNHKRFGEANAILAGDGLLTAAALVLCRQEGFDLAKVSILSAALEMVSGQSYDLNDTERTEESLQRLHMQKTGALFEAAFSAGACLAGIKNDLQKFADLGRSLGMLFQMTDDLIDAKKDISDHKFTFLTYYGEKRTRELVKETESRILTMLSPFMNDAAEELKMLVKQMAYRTE